MPVSFNSVPDNWRIPLVWIEVDPSKAGFPTRKQPALLVGQKLTAGTATADVPIPVSTLAQAKAYFGEGSMLERMVDAFLGNNFAHELWCLPVVEPSGGVTASGTITVTNAPSAAGTLSLYIAGQLVEVAVGATDTITQVAAAIATAIGAIATLPVTASPSVGVVTLTSKWKGLTGNDIDVRVNYGGTLAGEVMPTGLALTISNSGKLANGTSAPSFTAAIANLGDEDYEYVGLPFTDSTSLGAWETEYGFGDTGRWGFIRQQYGHIFSAIRDTYANLLTFGASRNTGQTSVMAVEVNSPSPIWAWAGAYTAKAARALLNDPARPLQTLTFAGIKPAPKHQRFAITEINNLAGNGLATQATDASGTIQIKRGTTTYQKNSYSQGDDAYTDVTTLATLARLFRNLKHAITSKFPRHKLANDGTRFGVGQAIVTPKIIKAELVAQYRLDEFLGLVEDAANFKKNLVVERDANNPNRINVLYPPDLVNQLIVFAVLGQFRLQYDRGVDLAIV
jgi:phage tail sheath gpL-like